MNRVTCRFLVFMGGVASATLVASAFGQAAASASLTGHRAIYNLTLAQSRGKQSMESVRGRILYDFSGSACEGYTLNFRQVTELDSGEGKRAVSDLRSSHWEAGDGSSFRFATQNFLDGQQVDNSEGGAERKGDDITIALTKPEHKRIEASNVVFPSDHIRRIIIAARAGKPLLEIGAYDGSENGEKIYNTLTVIGRPITLQEQKPDDAAAEQRRLDGVTRWPVTVSYFDRAKQTGDQTPAYAITFELYENGIARAIKLDYGDFVLDGQLSTLEIKEAAPCR
ncbi:MAG TPA: cell envelope integrity EipB family protein [Xanthobacteraceae bacterium]|nr:cell envelope integrity EipB family protein [Xanthobacteraceae bacterium]